MWIEFPAPVLVINKPSELFGIGSQLCRDGWWTQQIWEYLLSYSSTAQVLSSHLDVIANRQSGMFGDSSNLILSPETDRYLKVHNLCVESAKGCFYPCRWVCLAICWTTSYRGNKASGSVQWWRAWLNNLSMVWKAMNAYFFSPFKLIR